MCGRFSLMMPPEQWPADWQIEEFHGSFAVNPNIAPTQSVAALVARADGRRAAGWMRWGLVPNWASDTKKASSLINARLETLAEKPSFRALISRKRCAIAADSYFEWQTVDGRKQPYRVTLPAQPLFLFAGLYDTWRSPTGEWLHTCTVITTAAAPEINWLHERMPVILDEPSLAAWLNPHVREGDGLVQSLHALVPPVFQIQPAS
jgi:putative SOS response-associated peptidase YedK